MSKDDLELPYNKHDNKRYNIRDLIIDNIRAERIFKTEVLDWPTLVKVVDMSIIHDMMVRWTPNHSFPRKSTTPSGRRMSMNAKKNIGSTITCRSCGTKRLNIDATFDMEWSLF